MTINLIKIQEKIPGYVRNVADVLIGNNYEAFLVGGAVRDLMMDREPKDYDLATNALPSQMEAIFPRCITTNARFGTVLVIMESDNDERFDVEVTTYRKEEDYFGGRWPAKVEFTKEILTDLSRRDFTINAMAVNMKKLYEFGTTQEEVFLDPFGGINDMNNHIIRAVGNAIDRFSEDGLRAFKACRLASELTFTMELETFDAINQTLTVARMISMERIRDEFVKLIMYSSKPSIGLELMRKSGLLEIFLPELIDNIGIVQPEYHSDDVYTHSLKSLDIAEDSVKIAALLHDLGKASTRIIDEQGGVHFYGHDVKGVEIAKQILERLKFPNSEIKRISNLIRWHMFYYPSAQWRKEYSIDELLDNESNKEKGGWTDAAIRRFLKNVGEESVDDLFKLRIADATANIKTTFDTQEIFALQKRISEIKLSNMALKITDLAVCGNDLKQIGINAGPEMGVILNKLLNLVIEDPQINTKDQLLALAKDIK